MARELTCVFLFAMVCFVACDAQTRPDSDPESGNLWRGMSAPQDTNEAARFAFERNPKPIPDADVRKTELFGAGQESPKRGKPPKSSAPELKVVRFSPSGETKTTASVSVTFNQAMVPLSGVRELRGMKPPIEISPLPPGGKFRWLGTHTILYETPERFPYATEFSVKIPKGTASAAKKVLAKEESFTFQTPRPSVASIYPYDNNRQLKPDTAFLLTFNQRIQPRDVFPFLKLTANNTAVPLKLLSLDEAKARPDLKSLVSSLDEKRSPFVVAVAPQRKLPLDASIQLTAEVGYPSAEGPRTSKRAFSAKFRTYAPLRVRGIGCNYRYDQTCAAHGSAQIGFNNGLPAQDIKPFLKISPKPPANFNPVVGGDRIYLYGSWKAGSSYDVQVLPGLRDVHGQELARGTRKRISFRDHAPYFSLSARNMVAIESTGPMVLPAQATNVKTVEVQAQSIDPSDLYNAVVHLGAIYQRNWSPFAFQSKRNKIRTQKDTLRLKNIKNQQERVGIPLKGVIPAGRDGLAFVVAKSPDVQARYGHGYQATIVQSTDITLTLRYDNDTFIVLATRLSTGEPVPNAQIRILGRTGQLFSEGTTNDDGFFQSPGLRDAEGKMRRGANKEHFVKPLLVEARLAKERSYALAQGSGISGYSHGYNANHNSTLDRNQETRLIHSVISDRNIYRPGETVHWKGTMRSNDPYKGTRALPDTFSKVEYNIRDARGQVLVKEKTAPISAFGSFQTNFKIPLTAALGPLTITAHIQGATGNFSSYFQQSVSVQEYRAPEFQVSSKAGKEHYMFKESLLGEISAEYLFGAPMRGAAVSWNVTLAATNFTPPNQGKFQFGKANFGRYYMPWGETEFGRHRYGWRHSPARSLGSGAGVTNDDGKYTVETFIKQTFPNPYTNKEEILEGAWTLALNANVVDQNRQTVSTQTTALVHPASFYAGLKIKKSIVKEGENLAFSLVAADPKGERVPGQKLRARVLRRTSERALKKTPEGGYYYVYEQKEEVAGTCEVTTTKDPQPCAVAVSKAGYHIVEVTGEDDERRPVKTERGFYVYGKSFVPWNQDGNFTVEMILDKESYSVGDTARVLIKSPFERARGLLTLEHGFIKEHRLLNLDSSTTTIEVPITEENVPGLTVNLSLGRGRVQIAGTKAKQSNSDLGKPAVATTSVVIPIDLKTKQIAVDVKPSVPFIRPGDELDVAIETRDSAGKPIPTEVALFVVDEAVLSLLGYKTPDLAAVFFPSHGSASVLSDLRSILLSREKNLKLADSNKTPLVRSRNGLVQKSAGFMGGSGRGGGDMLDDVMDEAEEVEKERSVERDRGRKAANRRESRRGFQAESIKARTNFQTTAYANGSVLTDAQGRANVRIKMPENLTTYRIMAVAIDKKDQFGSGESSVKVRKPLLVRPSLPRFANLGDSFEAAVVVNNETSDDMVAVVGMRGTRMKTTGKDRREVRIESGKSVEVRFPVTVESSGTATFQFVVRSGQDADAAEVSIPVYIPVTTEAFATYGTTQGSVAQPVKLPEDVVPSWGSLDIEMSSTALTGLKDAVDYLNAYPYGCLEQTSSRLVPLVVMRDIVQDFKLEGLGSAKERDQRAREGIKRLEKMQKSNGGFSFWPGGRYTSPYASVYAYWVLIRAKESGYDVPQNLLARAERYIRTRLVYDTRRWGEWYNLSTRAHAAYVLALGGQPTSAAEVSAIYKSKDTLPLFSILHLYAAMSLDAKRQKKDTLFSKERKELRRMIDNAVVEKAGTAHFSEKTSEDLRLIMHSSTRTDAIALDILMLIDPDADVIPKVMRGLMQARQRTGYWSNTQENAYVVSAVSRYYAHYEKQPPEFTASIWYGEGYLGQETFAGRSTTVAQSSIPMSFLLQEGDEDIVLAKDGPGRLYYRLGLRYAPASRTLEAEEQGFSVSRTFEPIGDPNSVVKTDEGWTIKAGSDVKVKLTISVPDRAYHVAVNDPLPAGLEAVNLNFKTSNANLNSVGVGSTSQRGRWWWGSTFEHTEQRDERVLLFARALYAGVYEYTYVARSTTIGTFILPPLKAEEMYAPENFGRNGTQIVNVVP